MRRHTALRNARSRSPRANGWSVPAVYTVLAIGLAGCNLLDVDNPNNLLQEDIEKPTAAAALANGALSTVTRALADIGAPYSTVTDELTWIGSRDAWDQLDEGNVADPTNEYADGAFPDVAEARWLTDEAIVSLEGFQAEGTLTQPILLARAYLYGGIIYTTIADTFDDFAFSDRMEAAPPVGPDNMSQVYDEAIDYLTKGLTLVRTLGASEEMADLELRLLAMRARAQHARAVWGLLNPAGSAPGSPWVNDPGAAADAAEFVAAVGAGSDWRFQLEFNSATVSSFMATLVNQRAELQISESLTAWDEDDKISSVTLQDPIDGIADPVIQAELDVFLTNTDYSPITVASAREMHLILAEAALASGNAQGAELHINHVRAMNNQLTAFDRSNAAHPSAAELLKYERRVNLFLQLRRLADLYRFGEQSPKWLPTSTAVTTPGTFFPITIIEIRANPHIGG